MADEARQARLQAIRDAAEAQNRRDRIKAAADAIPEGDKRAAEVQFQRERGLQVRPGMFGRVLEVASRPMEAVHAAGRAIVKGEGNPLAEAGAALAGRREGTAAQNLVEMIPPVEGETPFGPRALLRLAGATVTDPLVFGKIGPLTAAGRAEMATAPQKFLGAGKLSRVERVEQGLQRTVGVGIPFVEGSIGLPRKIDAAFARGTKAALDAFGKTISKTVRATAPGRAAADALLDAFSKKGSSPDVVEARAMAEGVNEDALRKIFTHSRELPAVSKGADLVAEQMSKTAGRTITREEVLSHAFDYAENAQRDPARFADTPPVIREFADIELRPFVDSIRREINAEVRISPLSPPREAIADARIARVREAEDVLAQMDEVGVERLSIDELRGEALKPSAEGPTLFRAKTVEPKLKVAKPEEVEAPGLGKVFGKPAILKRKRQLFPPKMIDVERIARENRAAVEAARIETARRVELASQLNASIVKQVDLDVLEPRYLPHVATKYGREEFFQLTRDEMAKIANVPGAAPILRTKGADRFAKMRSFRRPDGTSLGAVEVNEMAKAGTLPGYEGIKAKGDIFSVEPIQFGLARLFEAEKAIAEMRLARKLADRFGVPRVDESGKLRSATELGGFEVVSEDHKILRHYAFPPAIAKEMKHTLRLMSPASGIQGLMLKAFQEINRLWVEWTLLPFFSTISRNAIGEWYFTFLGGGEVSDAAYALGIMADVWQPFRNALERGVSSDRALQKLREVGLARLEISGEGKLALLSEPAMVDDASKAFQGFTDAPDGSRVPFTWSPTAISEEAFSRGIVGGGWSPSELQETVRTALGQVKNETFLRKMFETSTASPFSRRFIGLAPNRKMQAFADDWPRMSHFVSMLRKGLTPNEAAFEVKKAHVSGNLTPFEQRYLRPLIPFYRWMRFNIPKTFETIVRHPQVPYQLHKAYEYLTLGGERVDERDLPPWMRDNAAVNTVTKTLEDGRRVLFVTTPTGLWPVADALEWSTPENAADYALSVWNPFLAYYADLTPSKYQAQPKDDSFLGVRMDAEKAATLRRLWRLGSVLDQMALPKGLSEDERAYKRWIALGRLASPVPLSLVEEGAGRKIESIKLKQQIKEAHSRRRRSLSRFGRLYGNPEDVKAVNEEMRQTIDDLGRQLRELQR